MMQRAQAAAAAARSTVYMYMRLLLLFYAVFFKLENVLSFSLILFNTDQQLFNRNLICRCHGHIPTETMDTVIKHEMCKSH